MTVNFRPLTGCALVLALSFMAGATLFAHAQTGEKQAVERAQSAMRHEGFGSRVRNDAFASPDGNCVVFYLGEVDYYGAKARSQAVYDFNIKKVFIVRLDPSRNDILVDSEALR